MPGKGMLPPEESEADALARAKREKEQLSLEVKDAEEDLERVKARYDQYFIGIERREPARERDGIRRRVMVLKDAFTRNAALQFRLQTLHARYLAYERLWVRSAREKEEGTYRRDIFKARLRAKRAKPEPTANPAALERSGTAAPALEKKALVPPPHSQASAAAKSADAGGATPFALGDPQMKALYENYVAAKRQCGEDVSRLSYETVARSISKRIPELITQYKAKSVDFRVEVKDGRAVLKAIPKA